MFLVVFYGSFVTIVILVHSILWMPQMWARMYVAIAVHVRVRCTCTCAYLCFIFFLMHIFCVFIFFLVFCTIQRATASVTRLQHLNPRAKLTVEAKPITDFPDAFFSNFNAIFATDIPVDVKLHLDSLVRGFGKTALICGQAMGYV
jgi:hypothetical protein